MEKKKKDGLLILHTFDPLLQIKKSQPKGWDLVYIIICNYLITDAIILPISAGLSTT